MDIREDSLLAFAAEFIEKNRKETVYPVSRRVAYIVKHSPTDSVDGSAIRGHGVAKALQNEGLDVLCFVTPASTSRVDKYISENRLSSEIEGLRYHYYSEPLNGELDETELLVRAVNYYIEAFSVYRPEAVIADGDCSVALAACIAAQSLGLPFFLDVIDLKGTSVPAAEDDPTKSTPPEQQRVGENYHYNKADAVITLNSVMKQELENRGVEPGKIHILPPGANEVVAKTSSRLSLAEQLRVSADEKIILFKYEDSEAHNLKVIKEACSELVEAGYELKLLIVASSATASQLADENVDNGDWIEIVAVESVAQLPDYYALADLTIIAATNVDGCDVTSPLSIAEPLTQGSRLIIPNSASLTEYARQYPGVEAFDTGSAGNLADVIQDSLSQPRPNACINLRYRNHIDQLVTLLTAQAHWNTPSKRNHVDYTTASQWFYREGRLTDTLNALENMQANNVSFNKPQREFKHFVEGLIRLKKGVTLPPRQPNPGLLTKQKNILYCLHQSVPHTTNGYSTRSHGIAVGLKQAGYNIRATTRPGFPWDIGTKDLAKGYHEAELDGVVYSACGGWNLKSTPLDYYMAEASDHFLREAQASNAEIIIAASNHITALPALLAARRLGIPFVYEVRGLWEVTQASTQPDWADSERYHLMRQLEQQVALEADQVITLTRELADELESWGVRRERIEIVPNAVDADLFRPMPKDEEIAELLDLQPDIPVIGYAGSAVVYEGLELLMDALAHLKKQGQAFNFVLVGDGKVIDTVKQKASELGIARECRFTGRVPFEQVPRYLSCMDIMPIPRLSSDVTEMVSALKPLEAMAMEKALLLSDVSPHKTMAGANGTRAQLFRKDQVESLSTELQLLLNDSDKRRLLGHAARKWVEEERTWQHVVKKYANVLDKLREKETKNSPSSNAAKLSDLRVGLIADKFTTDTLESAVNIVALSPQQWRQEIANTPIDVLFVESAWSGNNGQWHRKVGYYGEEEFAELTKLLSYCRENSVPSLFWNKEDPVHFERFRKTAALCDHVFTTDSRRIIPYLASQDCVTKTASSCPFYVSPKIHNLLPSNREWQNTAAYGGTYYGGRYPERTEYMDKIMSAAAPLGLTIYDRQHDDPDSPYKYPGGLGTHVVGSLSYEQMIQAYKAHPVQINVNSVLDSPTMFSRRVVETAACGSPLISGPALGMNRYLEGAGHIVSTETEAAQALENLLHYPAYRWRTALRAARAVMRSHTTQHRLVQMLRTAGMTVLAPAVPSITLVTESVTEQAAEKLIGQTLQPQRILAKNWMPESREQLSAAGIVCEDLQQQEAAQDSWYLVAAPAVLEILEPEDIEDLAWPTTYATQSRIGYIRDTELADGLWPGVALETTTIDDGFQLVKAEERTLVSRLAELAGACTTLALRKPSATYEKAPSDTPKKTVVIAGHDLKFIKPFYPYFSDAGIRVLLDFWTGHNKHNEAASKRLVAQADTIFCEWMLGNAIWYAKHKQKGQKLVGRLHLQEIDHSLFPKVPFQDFDSVMFVGPHILRDAISKNPALKENGIIVYNGVDVKGLQSVPRKQTNGKVLGFVGIVPQRKRFDLALDMLRELRKEDQGYILRIKGKRPEEFSWMANRPDEMDWYETQYRRLIDDPLLKGAVIFDPHGNDMPEWYAGIDFVLSTSDFESFHFTIADGAASGCTPIILPWEGADEIYPPEWVSESVVEATSHIKNNNIRLEKVRDFALQNFDIESKVSVELINNI